MFKQPILFLFIAFLASCLQTAAQTPVRNTYKFYNSLSTTEADCASNLFPITGLNTYCTPSTAVISGEFILDKLSVAGQDRIVYHNNFNWGLRYDNTSGVIGKTYTVQMYIKVVNFNDLYTRIIDFSNGVEDDGIYFKNVDNNPTPTSQRCLNFYPDGNFGVCPFFNNNTYYLLTITRDDATKKIDIYVNDQLFTTYNDVADFYVSTVGKPVYIFRDDPFGANCEDGEAYFAYLSFANFYSTQSDIASIYNNITTIANTADFTVTPSASCVDKDVTITYNGDIPATAMNYTFNWSWDGGQVISGSDRGPYVVRWNAAGAKRIRLNITGGDCFKPITNLKQVVISTSGSSQKDTTICAGETFEGYTTSGTFVKTFSSGTGCDSIRTVNLTVVRAPTSFLDTTICAGNSVEGYTASGTYVKTFPKPAGCDSVMTVQLTVIPAPTSYVDTTICEGHSFEGYNTAGTFTKIIPGTAGCDSTRTVKLSIQQKKMPELGSNTILCIGDSTVLYPGLFDTYRWQDGSTQSSYIVKAAGLYKVLVTDKCVNANDEIIITASDCTIYFPTAFSPNRDGVNEVFKILNITANNLSQYKLAVYTRFGDKVFETNDPDAPWTGSIDGKDAASGTYVWYCTYKKKSNDPAQTIKGSVMLIH
ncbi:MAG: gliding motility-associated C-terminal domain-containing protein [Bacteroidota bacterium]